MGAEKPEELWDRLDTEPARAYRAFQEYLTLPGPHRTILGAYRNHVGNPEAVKPSDTWMRWSRTFAWAERATAYDDHLATLRRKAHERGIEAEAERQGSMVERMRAETFEMLERSYEKAAQWLEEAQPSDLRAQDIIQIIRLHLEAVKTLQTAEKPEEKGWTEDDDQEFVQEILPQVKAERDNENGDQGSEEQKLG